MNKFTAIKSKNILTPEGFVNGFVIIKDEKILDIAPKLNAEFTGETIDVGDSFILPGIIDCHVHINEPGRTLWEGFETATRAAAAGGITTLIEMPLNASPVTTNQKNFEIKLKASANKLAVNCGFWGGVVPNNLNELDELLNAGVFGLKAFLTHSGIDDFPNTTREELFTALVKLKKQDLPLLVHCELESAEEIDSLEDANPTIYNTFLKSRPKSWENEAIKLMIELCRETGARVHIVHVSSADALPLIAAAKKEGLPITAETCPHYLVFSAETVQDGDTSFKCAPPIRERENNEKLWEALKEGTLDFIVTDHSPAPPDLKEVNSGNFMKAWGGISGLQFSLPAIWTAAKTRGISIELISKWISWNIAQFLDLGNSKGRIQKGYDADLIVWNPEKEFIVTQDLIEHRHKITPYEGLKLCGVVEQTYVLGKCIYAYGKFLHLTEGKLLFNSNSSSAALNAVNQLKN